MVPEIGLRYLVSGNHCCVCDLNSLSLTDLLTASASQVVQPLADSPQAPARSQVVPALSMLVEETAAEGVTW